MNESTGRVNRFSGSGCWRGWLLAACLAVLAPASQAAKDTPFGVEIIPRNFPASTHQDALEAIGLASLIGSHGSKIGVWGDPEAFSKMAPMVNGMRLFGMKSLLQLGTTFLGKPAPPPGYAQSFNDPNTRARLLADVLILAQAEPEYLVLTTEVNLMHRFHRQEFEYYRSLHTEAYNLIKATSPNTKVGASFLYSLWFADFHIDNVDVPAKLQPVDFIAFTTYPEWLLREGHFASIADIPREWYGAARNAYPNASIIFSEVGWASKVRGTPEIQQEYIRNLPRLMSTVRPELVTWAVLHDVEYYTRSLLTPEATAFLESIGVDIDGLFGHFNGMGLLNGFGVPKPGFYDAAQLNFLAP
jgi:hypothetical protein